jgi:cryptochrome
MFSLSSSIVITSIYYNFFLLQQVVGKEPIKALNSQLMWREYFYVMSVNNPDFDHMEGNPICLQIPWYDNPEQLEKWKKVSESMGW